MIILAAKVVVWVKVLKTILRKCLEIVIVYVSCKGVYPQSDRSLAIVDIDAAKAFVDLLVHLTSAIFAIFVIKRQLKLLEMAWDQVQTSSIFPL